MKKIISFSLWGKDPKYTIGAIQNAKLAKEIYPDWICRYYIGKTTPTDIVKELGYFGNTEIVIMENDGNWTSMFWRFYPAADETVDVMISRDCDSRLNMREKEAVDEWLNSNKGFHIMRDHPWHSTEILGGMWGVKKGILPNIIDQINTFNKGEYWQVDQNFLTQKIYPIVKDISMVHDEFFKYDNHRKPFPSVRINKEFVGDVFDQNNIRHSEYYKLL